MLRLVKELSGTTQQQSSSGEMFLAGQSVGALSGALVNPVEVLKILNHHVSESMGAEYWQYGQMVLYFECIFIYETSLIGCEWVCDV